MAVEGQRRADVELVVKHEAEILKQLVMNMHYANDNIIMMLLMLLISFQSTDCDDIIVIIVIIRETAYCGDHS